MGHSRCCSLCLLTISGGAMACSPAPLGQQEVVAWHVPRSASVCQGHLALVREKSPPACLSFLLSSAAPTACPACACGEWAGMEGLMGPIHLLCGVPSSSMGRVWGLRCALLLAAVQVGGPCGPGHAHAAGLTWGLSCRSLWSSFQGWPQDCHARSGALRMALGLPWQ